MLNPYLALIITHMSFTWFMNVIIACWGVLIIKSNDNIIDKVNKIIQISNQEKALHDTAGCFDDNEPVGWAAENIDSVQFECYNINDAVIVDFLSIANSASNKLNILTFTRH